MRKKALPLQVKRQRLEHQRHNKGIVFEGGGLAEEVVLEHKKRVFPPTEDNLSGETLQVLPISISQEFHPAPKPRSRRPRHTGHPF
jgi:hypothetical protein